MASNMRAIRRRCVHVLVAAFILTFTCAAANAEVALIGVQYRTDHPCPEYECFWHDGGYNDGPDSSYPNTCGPSSPIGASVHLFLKNNNATNVTLQNVQLAGVSLTQALAWSSKTNSGTQPASVYLAKA